MAFGLKDIVLAIKLSVDRSSAEQVKKDLKDAIDQGTAPENAEKNLGRIESAIGSLTGKLEKLLVGLVAAFATRVVFNFIEESVMLFAKFDQKLQQSVAIMGRMGDSMRKDLGNTARELAKELGISADEIAEGYYYLASAGLNAAQSIRALPIAAAFAKAGLMDMKSASDYLTLAVSALGYASKDPEKNFGAMARVADVLTLASKRSQATLEQLTSALTNKTAQSLRIFHKDVEEGAAALMVLADAGVRGQVAGERLDIFLRQVTQSATKHAAEFRKYGIAIFDTHGKMRNLADVSHDLTKALGGLSDRQLTVALGELGIQQRTQASVKVFIGAEQALRDYEAMMQKAGGTTVKIADRMMLTPMEQWKKFTETIKDGRREIGEHFMPTMDGFMKEFAGEEGDPHSLVGMLHQFAEGLDNSSTFLHALGSAIGWIVREPIAILIDAFNIVADLIVGPLNFGLASLGAIFFALGIVSYSAAAGVGEFLKWIGLDTAGAAVDSFAHKLANLTTVMGKFTADRASTSGQNFTDIWTRLVGGEKVPPKSRLLDNKPTTKGGRDKKAGGGDDGDGEETEKEKAAREKKERQIQNVNDRLDAILAKHTQTRVDDELLGLKKIEEEYHKLYGSKIPKEKLAEIKAAKAIIKQEGAANDIAGMFKEEFKDGEEQDDRKLQELQVFINRVTKLKEGAKEGSKEWKIYTDVLEKAMKLLNKLADKSAADEEKRQAQIRKDAEKDATDRLKRIGRITDTVGKEMTRAFDRAFHALTSGSRRGIDALHALKDVALTALSAPLQQYALNKTKEQMLEAGDDFAKGWSFLSNPATAAFAPGMFASAAKHLAQGTAWAALGGGASAATGGLSTMGGASGRYTDTGRNQVDKSSPVPPEINIWVDGMNPDNAAHMKLVGQALEGYVARGGGNLKIDTRR